MAQPIGTYSYSDPTLLSHWVRNLLYIDLIVTLISLISDVGYSTMLQGVAAGDRNLSFMTMSVLSTSTGQLVDTVALIVNLAVGVVVLCWIYRIMANSWALTDYEMEFTPGWAVGSYFIPFVNLWQPYRVMQDLWKENVEAEEHAKQNNISLWWSLWLGSIFINLVVTRIAVSNAGLGALRTAMLLSMLGSVVNIVLNLVFLSIVRTITAAQVDRYEQHEIDGMLGEERDRIAWE